MPDFDVTVLTLRSGVHTLRVSAEDAASARAQVQSACDPGEAHSPVEFCVDDLESNVLEVKRVALDQVIIISADRAGLGTLYSDDGLTFQVPTLPSGTVQHSGDHHHGCP